MSVLLCSPSSCAYIESLSVSRWPWMSTSCRQQRVYPVRSTRRWSWLCPRKKVVRNKHTRAHKCKQNTASTHIAIILTDIVIVHFIFTEKNQPLFADDSLTCQSLVWRNTPVTFTWKSRQQSHQVRPRNISVTAKCCCISIKAAAAQD